MIKVEHYDDVVGGNKIVFYYVWEYVVYEEIAGACSTASSSPASSFLVTSALMKCLS